MSTINEAGAPSKPLSEKLKSLLDGDHSAIRDDARAFLSNWGAVPSEITKEDHREITVKRVKDIADAGYAKFPFPKEYGGEDRGADFLHFVEILSYGDISTIIKQGVNYGLFGMGVLNLGTERHHAEHLDDIMHARLLGGFAMTEMGGGSNVQGLQTTAVYDKDKDTFVINTPHDGAKKAYIGNAANHGEMMIVFAQLKMSEDAESEGVHAFLVPVRDKQSGDLLPGIHIEDHGKKIGLNGVDNATIGFDDVEIPRTAMLDKFATVNENGEYHSDIESKTARFFKMISTLVTGRVSLSLTATSVAKNALTHSIQASENREVFGETLLDMQATQSLLFPALAETFALHFYTRDLIDDLSNGGSRDLETKAAIMKARSSDFAFETVDNGRKKMGGEGYVAKYSYGDMRNDIDVFRTFEGDNTVLRLFVAKNLLSDLKNEFKGLNKVQQTAKGLSMKFNIAAARHGLNKWGASRKKLIDPGFVTGLVEVQEKALKLGLSEKVMKSVKETGDAKKAFDRYQNDAVLLADTYSTRLLLEKFNDVVDAQDDPELKAVLGDIRDLFAMTTLQKNSKWLLEKGFLSSEQSREINRIVIDLQEKIRPNAMQLVESFDIPDNILAPAPRSNKDDKPRGPQIRPS